jgi:hypothetical protein
MGRPQTGCSAFGSEERMRVPSPAAMINTVGASLTYEIVEPLPLARGAGCGAARRAPLGSLVERLALSVEAS